MRYFFASVVYLRRLISRENTLSSLTSFSNFSAAYVGSSRSCNQDIQKHHVAHDIHHTNVNKTQAIYFFARSRQVDRHRRLSTIPALPCIVSVQRLSFQLRFIVLAGTTRWQKAKTCSTCKADPQPSSTLLRPLAVLKNIVDACYQALSYNSHFRAIYCKERIAKCFYRLQASKWR